MSLHGAGFESALRRRAGQDSALGGLYFNRANDSVVAYFPRQDASIVQIGGTFRQI
jgi:hypothetical protein